MTDATTQADREGPAPIITVSRPACDGCKHLRTEWWKDYLENDETDSGTSAECGAVPTDHGGKPITAYWSKGNPAPSWCPFPAPRTATEATAKAEVERLPRLDDGLIEAAMFAHYGKNAGHIDGLDLTVDGRNWTFREGFKRMWAGVRNELKRRAALSASDAGEVGNAQR